MKLSPLAPHVGLSLIAASAPSGVASIRCGIPSITKPCIGETDVRYDPDEKNTLAEQDGYFRMIPGLYVSSQYRYDAADTGLPKAQDKMSVARMDKKYGTWNGFPSKVFHNITVDGTRMEHRKFIFKMHNGDQNVTDPEVGTAAIPGGVTVREEFYTSTFEKDGSVHQFAGRAGPNEKAIEADPFPVLMQPFEGRSLYGQEMRGRKRDIAAQFAVYCLDDGCSQWRHFVESYDAKVVPYAANDLLRENATAVDAATWMSELRAAIVEYNVITPSSFEAFHPAFSEEGWARQTLPFELADDASSTPECTTGPCPSEDVWAQSDPTLQVSPYQEPNGELESWVIALAVILGVVAFSSIAYALHLNVVRKQKRRYKEHFVRGIARNITIAQTPGMVDAKQLKREFDHIDADGGGTISKDEMWAFVESGKIGVMERKDFEAMWHALDIDGSGEVDFVEFTAFLASCGEEFEKVDREQRAMTKEQKLKFASQRLSVRDLRLAGEEDAPGSGDAGGKDAAGPGGADDEKDTSGSGST